MNGVSFDSVYDPYDQTDMEAIIGPRPVSPDPNNLELAGTWCKVSLMGHHEVVAKCYLGTMAGIPALIAVEPAVEEVEPIDRPATIEEIGEYCKTHSLGILGCAVIVSATARHAGRPGQNEKVSWYMPGSWYSIQPLTKNEGEELYRFRSGTMPYLTNIDWSDRSSDTAPHRTTTGVEYDPEALSDPFSE